MQVIFVLAAGQFCGFHSFVRLLPMVNRSVPVGIDFPVSGFILSVWGG